MLAEAWADVSAGGSRRARRLRAAGRRQVAPGRRAPPAGRGRRGDRARGRVLELPRRRPRSTRCGGSSSGPPGSTRTRTPSSPSRACGPRWRRSARPTSLPADRRPPRPAADAVVPRARARRARSCARSCSPRSWAGCGPPRRVGRCCSSSTTSSGPTRPPSSCSAGSIAGQIPGLLVLLTVRDDAKVPWSAADVAHRSTGSPADELGDLARRLPEGRALSADAPRAGHRAQRRHPAVPRGAAAEQRARPTATATAPESTHPGRPARPAPGPLRRPRGRPPPGPGARHDRHRGAASR